MTVESIQLWLNQNPDLAPWAVLGAMLLGSVVVYLIARSLIARGLVYLAQRTESTYDDLVVEELRPYRFAWIAPLLIIYFLAPYLPGGADLVQQIVLFLILWLAIITVNSLLNAVNAIYEASPYYHGEPIQGYLDLVKILLILGAGVVTVSLFTGESPLVLLSGLGALTAVIILVFRDTILSFVASLQIRSNDLILEGDWIEIPSYGADGDVLNIALHTVTIQNFDKTISVIPTYKLLDSPYKNWRGMEESGGRRIKRSISIDLNCIEFCDQAMIERLQKIDLIEGYMQAQLAEIEQWNVEQNVSPDNPLNSRQITNAEAFRAYVIGYLKSRQDLHQEGMTMLVRQLPTSPTGMPIEVYAFSKSTVWAEYEATQADIFDHLLASLPQFGLRVFQEPTGLDFQAGSGATLR